MNKYLLALIFILSASLIQAEITQDDIDINVCTCKDHPFKAKVKALIDELGITSETEVTEGWANFESTDAVNDVEIVEEMKAIKHLEGEQSCCDNRFLGLLRVVASKIFEQAQEEPPMAARALFALPKLCKVGDGEGIPQTVKDFLSQYKNGEDDGPTLLKELAQNRIEFAVNHLRRLRGLITAMCISPCYADEYIQDGTVLVNEESENANQAAFDTAKENLGKVNEKIKKAIEFFMNKFGTSDCKSKLDKIKQIIDKSKNDTTRKTKIRSKPEGQVDDATATTEGADIGVDSTTKSPRTKKDGTEEELPDTVRENIEKKKKEIKDAIDAENQADKTKATNLTRLNTAKLAAQKQFQKDNQIKCNVAGCFKCDSDDSITCTQCFENISLFFVGTAAGTESARCIPNYKCEDLSGTLTTTDVTESDNTTVYKKSVCLSNAALDCKSFDKNCDACSSTDASQCQTCVEGFVVSNGRCIPKCVVGEKKCSTCGSTGLCTACESGFELKQDRCFEVIAKTCTDGQNNCTTCESRNTGNCQTCAQNYVAVNGKCAPVCVDGQRGCTTCDTNDTHLCATCDDQHDKYLGFCKPKLTDGSGPRPPSGGRRYLQDSETDTQIVANGGISANVEADEDEDAIIDGVTEDGCVDETECEEPTEYYEDDVAVELDSEGNAVDSSNTQASANSNILSATIALLFMVIFA